MAKESGSREKVGAPPFIITPGNIVTPVEGFANNAGEDKPPGVGEYGKPRWAEMPKEPKKPSGDHDAFKKFMGDFKGKKK